MKYIPAKPISYGGKRKLSSIKYIVIHYTANKGDTAENNGNYFKNVNTRAAGAHYFVDQKGNTVQSIKDEYIAYAVGGKRVNTLKVDGGKYYNKCTNANSLSIELCDIVDKEPSAKQIAAVKKLCDNYPDAKIIRHFDVTGKLCPASMIDKAVWNNFKKSLKKVKKDES